MAYKVVVTEDAETDLENFVTYLLFEKNNDQAAKNLLSDFDATIQSLSLVAESLRYCENPRLKRQGYRRMNFLSHRYFLLYRVAENVIFVDNIFRELQDYESRLY